MTNQVGGSVTTPDPASTVTAAHAVAGEALLPALGSSPQGLGHAEAVARLNRYGRNALPRATPPGIARLFLRQFLSPLIYVLLAAAVVCLLIQEWSDAGFIAAVLLLNAIIGTVQEHSAHRAAVALQQLVTTRSRVLRDGETYEIDAEELVPGDVVLLESGSRVPADLRLLRAHDLEVDESLLTGESLAVLKRADAILPQESVLADRINMAFAGTLVSRGRGRGVVIATALATEVGQIAEAVLGRPGAKAPLLVRMERFTRWVAVAVGVATAVMTGVAFLRGMALTEVFLVAVALAVSAIPEGLPVALTVALAISMRRMARRHVIVRRLVAVEALGSCTFIATDKTGTLTVNQLTVRSIVFPGREPCLVTGESLEPEGVILTPRGTPSPEEEELLAALCHAAVLTNEGALDRRDHGWSGHGDAVDVALLVMGHKAGIRQAETRNRLPELAAIPFESERRFSATVNDVDGVPHVFVKGALEQLLPMCASMAGPEGATALDGPQVESQAYALASQGYRVIAFASGAIATDVPVLFSEDHLHGLTFLGLAGLIDPLRGEAKAAVAACRDAGIEVAMVTGDHPDTALAIARELDLADSLDQVVTGPQLKQASDGAAVDRLTRGARIFARVEPQQKLDIVQSLQRNGHFVAVSGDGANDAPALRAAQVGVAMGKSGTDVARETAELIVADDNFASIVAGVEEGRIAYANVRKVIFLLISTGAAELVLFTLALITGHPLPLVAVQLLWLNLVTNGIQDVALAFEPGEGDELRLRPRPPREAIFNGLMIERVLLSALVMGGVAFLCFQILIHQGIALDEARNSVLLLMVLFENVQVFNSRSEGRSVFSHSPLRNPLLLFGTVAAQLVHIGAMYTPWLREVLAVRPVTPHQWLGLLALALTLLAVMEAHKVARRALRARAR
ncbi:MAG: HAD-IC family P-type ATPase [Nitrospirota bacterium]